MVADAVNIVVADLPDDGTRLSGQTALETIARESEGELVVKGPVAYDLRVSRLGSTVTVEGRLEATVEIDCSRCARRFEVPVDRTFDAVFVTSDSGEADHTVELDERDLDLDYYRGDVIDGSRLLAEQVLLEMPMKILCSEDCRGLCPKCGINLNETDCDCEPDADPRWDSLIDLRDRL